MALLTDNDDINKETAHINSVIWEIERYLLQPTSIATVQNIDTYEHLAETALRRITDEPAVGGETLATRYQLEPLNEPKMQTFEHIRQPELNIALNLLRAYLDMVAHTMQQALASSIVRDSATEQVRQGVNGRLAFDPEDDENHLFAIAWPGKNTAIRILCWGQELRRAEGKLLLQANLFLGHAAHMGYGARNAKPEIFPISLTDNTETLDAAFELWSPAAYDWEHSSPYLRHGATPAVYDKFDDALTAAKLLLR